MKQNSERQKKHGKRKYTDESDFSENEILDLNSLGLLNLNQKQTSELLTVVAVMLRKKVLNIK